MQAKLVGGAQKTWKKKDWLLSFHIQWKMFCKKSEVNPDIDIWFQLFKPSYGHKEVYWWKIQYSGDIFVEW